MPTKPAQEHNAVELDVLQARVGGHKLFMGVLRQGRRIVWRSLLWRSKHRRACEDAEQAALAWQARQDSS